MNTKKVCRLAFMGAATLIVSTVARTQTTAPDLSFYSFSDMAPNPNGVISVSLTSQSVQSVTADVVFYQGSVHAGTAVQFHRQAVTIAGLANVSAPPRPLNDGEFYSICIDPNNTVAERNENNNCKVISISSTYSDLSATVRDIAIAPVGANIGEPMRVSAVIRSERDAATQALVRLFQGHPEAPNAKFLAQASVRVPGNGSAVANWTAIRREGETNLFVQIADVMPRDAIAGNNIGSRNIFLKGIIDTGRAYAGGFRASTLPAIGDLTGSGHPVMVFSEHTGNSITTSEARVTALQVFNDGTTKELWSRVPVPAPAEISSPSMADLDADGTPEIIIAAGRFLGGTSGEVRIMALDPNGNTKWMQRWDTVGRVPCVRFASKLTPLLADMNKDGVADVVVLENELVVLDGRNGAVLWRKSDMPATPAGWCGTAHLYGTIADVDADGSNEIIIGNYGIWLFNSDGTLRWKNAFNNLYSFALVDVEKDGKPEIIVPVHRQLFLTLDARTGVQKKSFTASGWSPFSDTIAATTSLDPAGLPSLAIANNDYTNGTGVLDGQLNLKWWTPNPLSSQVTDNPSHVVLADLLGQGRPQVISASDRRSIGIQDIKDGRWLLYLDVFGAAYQYEGPIPVDVDGDGRGEVIVGYGNPRAAGRLEYEPVYPQANYLIFGSDHWKKIPATWNHSLFVPHQVDKKLAFRHDYLPYKTHNTWYQQPLRKPCDIDFDDDVDQGDINLIFTARGQQAAEGDPRDFDKDGAITVSDSRACALKCTSASCAGISQPPRILSVGPRTAFPGSSITVTIRGEFVSFKPGETKASFGPGVSVGGAGAGAMGPVTVIDFETATANLTIQPGQTGERTVTVATGTLTAARVAAFSLSAGNLPPVVQAGPDQQVILPGSVSLSGIAKDDGMPNPKLTVTWQAVGGPGLVTFSNPSALATTASFSKEGYYHLRLSATDGQYLGSDDLGVRVIVGNEAPYVSAGPDLTSPADAPARLAGEVQDDGLPFATAPAMQWSKVSGPGTVAFTPANAALTSAAFSAVGTYVLRLSANDTQRTGSDEVTVNVIPPLPQILGVTPDSGATGQTRTVVVTTKNTNFATGVTQAHFGAGISVGGASENSWGPVKAINATTIEAAVTVAAGAAPGARSISIRTGAEKAHKADAFTVGTIGVPHSVRLNLTNTAIAPGGTIAARPQTIDAGGNAISSPGQVFTMTVTPQPGLTTGSAPLVSGLSVSFPKLVKRTINQNPIEDPTGEFADGDPADPNYGKETGGLYTIEVKLQGSSVVGRSTIVVLPSGTAAQTLKIVDYANQLGNALAAGRQATLDQDAAAIDAVKGQLRAIAGNVDFSLNLLAANNVLTPPNGHPPTIAQVAARFPAAPDDAAFGQAVNATIAHVRLVRKRIDAINPASVSQADLDALAAGAATFRNLNQQLSRLKPGPRGVTQYGDGINELLRSELPRLFDAMSRKALAVLQPAPVTSLKAIQTRAAIGDFFSNLFSIFTDLKGYALGNIIELAISLANDLVNIAVANAVNAASDGSLSIDFVAAGGQFSFACPSWQNTYIEGSGFSADVSKNVVAVIGCINSYALRNLLTLKKPKDLAAAIRVINKIISLADAAGRDQSIAAVEWPNTLREGLFGGSQMVFNDGWQRVNQGRLPCVGIVIAVNLETGDFQAMNMNMLPTCQ